VTPKKKPVKKEESESSSEDEEVGNLFPNGMETGQNTE
jgi:hypothetical protein